MERLVNASQKSVFGPFTIHIIYQCELNAQMKQDPDLKGFISNYVSQWSPEPLLPRAAMRGGRTEDVMHHIIPKDGETLHYVDFTS